MHKKCLECNKYLPEGARFNMLRHNRCSSINKYRIYRLKKRKVKNTSKQERKLLLSRIALKCDSPLQITSKELQRLNDLKVVKKIKQTWIDRGYIKTHEQLRRCILRYKNTQKNPFI